jgi:hypothetical protein
MNDTFELWSLPWHAQLRSLAKGFGAESAGGESCAGSGCPPETAGRNSWLVRARSTQPAT